MQKCEVARASKWRPLISRPMSQLAERLTAMGRTGNFTPAELKAFSEFIGGTEEKNLFRTGPYRYSELTGTPVGRAVDLFLHATRAGILDFSWGVLCPGCSAFLTTPAALKNLTQEGECRFCEIKFENSVDDNIEVAFTVSPAVRKIRFHDLQSLDFTTDDGAAVLFSTAKEFPPGMWRKIAGMFLAAGWVSPGAAFETELDLKPGVYRMNNPLLHRVTRFEALDGDGPSHLDFTTTPDLLLPAKAQVKAGRVKLRLTNATDNKLLFSVMPQLPGTKMPLKKFLTAKELLAAQAFRDLFRAESLPAGNGLALRSLTLLFTDLKSSTELYERVGDLKAYDLVSRHFTLLRDIVASHRGSVVKTIGDAIMACFTEPGPALEAAKEMVAKVPQIGSEVLLKVGIHSGPCIAVESNERLDYFGQTVNIAARVQALAGSQEIVVTEPIMKSDGADKLMAGAVIEDAALKGVDNKVRVYRLR